MIQDIYGQGGRNFWIHNTGPLGCLPYILNNLLTTAAQIDRVGCATPINDIAQYFNRRLKKTIVKLRKNLPLSAITYVDIYKVKYLLISQAKKHGNSMSCFTFKKKKSILIQQNEWLRSYGLSLFYFIVWSGFNHPLRACCGYGGKYNFNSNHRCGAMVKNGTEIVIVKSCKDPMVKINWDGVHYTEAANKFVFDQIVDGSFSDPPIPLNMACHRQNH